MATLTLGPGDHAEKESFSPSSKFIELVEYDPKALAMDVTFKSGTKIRYLVCYPATFLSFKKSPTHDSYYGCAIRGNMASVKLIDAGIGRKQFSPLKKLSKENHLDAGIRKQRARDERISGTVTRAFHAAAAQA